jgi:hypothetical protein
MGECSFVIDLLIQKDSSIDTPHGSSRGILATGGELVSGVATHEYRNHFTLWACPAPCDFSVVSGDGIVRGASHEATASVPFSHRCGKTESIWCECSHENRTGAIPMPKGRGLHAGY